MKIAKQKATLNAHLGDCLYFMFGNIKAYFQYSSAKWSGRGGESGNGDDLPAYLVQIYGKPFGPHEVEVSILSGVIIPDPECLITTASNVVYLKNVVFNF